MASHRTQLVSWSPVWETPLAESLVKGTDSTVHFRGDQVVKRDSPRGYRVLRWIGPGVALKLPHNVACSTFLKSWAHDDDAGEMVFRYVADHAVTLREHLVRRSDTELMWRVGQALGYIHESGTASDRT